MCVSSWRVHAEKLGVPVCHNSVRLVAKLLLGVKKAPLRGLKSVRENLSFAPLGLVCFPLLPTACAVGCILTPLRG
jgi:hypothetical protein